MTPKILVVDDRESVLELVATILSTYDVTRAGDGASAIALLASQDFDAIVTDVRMPCADGFEVLQVVKRRALTTQVVIMTAFASVPDAVTAVKQGAYDYIEKPFDPDDMALVVARAVAHRRRVVDEAAMRRRMNAVASGVPGTASVVSMPYREAVEAARDRASREYLVALMCQFAGSVTGAAERAGMERESLQRLLKRYGLHSDEFRSPAMQPRGDSGA
jgi:DNA-binding NtrC family response regulator